MALVHKIEISYLLIPKGGTFSKIIYMANKQNNEQTTRRYHQTKNNICWTWSNKTLHSWLAWLKGVTLLEALGKQANRGGVQKWQVQTRPCKLQ